MTNTPLPSVQSRKFKTVAVLKGGWSHERNVSQVSGKACADALRACGYDVREIDVTRDLEKLLRDLTQPEKPDVVFNALHGIGGEDGCIQSILDILDIPYTHSKRLASALAMDKSKSKAVVFAYGVRGADAVVLPADVFFKTYKNLEIQPPMVIKPNQEGSSFGVHIIHEGDNRLDQISKSWDYGDMIIEKYIPGRELTVSVMSLPDNDARALTVTEIAPNTAFYDYEAKYADGGSKHILPADISPDVFNLALQWAKTAHIALGCGGVSRTDFRYDDSQTGTNGLYYLETNTQPGMTPTSLVPEQAAYCGMDFNALVQWITETAS